MYVKTLPKSSNKNPMSLAEIFSNANNRVYPIKSDLQRRFCWTDNEVDNLIEQYVIYMLSKNMLADERGDDSVYGTIGDGIVCKEAANWNGTGCTYNELVDMSQRITTAYAICLVLLYLHMKNEGISNVDERRKLIDSYVKTKNKKSFKVETTFKDCEMKNVYDSIVNNTITFSQKELHEANVIFKHSKNTVYKPFSHLVNKVYSTITTIVGTDADFKLYLDEFLNKTYIQVEECDNDVRVEKFREVNSYRVGVTDVDIYKTLLCDVGPSIDDKYQMFETAVKRISSNANGGKKRINLLKAKYTVTEYIMKCALITLTKDDDICKFDYKLSDVYKGIEWQLNNKDGILKTEDDVLTFLDKCIDMCDFLYTSMDYTSDPYESWYMFSEYRNSDRIWLYCILPCYVNHNMTDKDCKEYGYNMLLKSYLTYSLRYFNNRSVQYIQQYMFVFALKLLVCESKGIDTLKDELNYYYNKTFGAYLREELSDTISHLSYEGSSSQSAIRGIFATIEYLTQRKVGVIKDNVYRFVTGKNNNVDIEHIMPKSLKNDDNVMYINGIGNLTLLESSLNSAKIDVAGRTSERYNDSSFITTKLINEDSRYEGLTNKELTMLRDKMIPFCCSDVTLNSFSVDEIKQRKTGFLKFIRNFLSVM